jgi:hypothetical protein
LSFGSSLSLAELFLPFAELGDLLVVEIDIER